MIVVEQPSHRVVPELDGVVRFALGQLGAGALVVLDQRSAPGELVAVEGPAAGELLPHIGVLPELLDSPDGDEFVPTRIGRDLVISAPVSLEDAPPIGTLHILYQQPSAEPDWPGLVAGILPVIRQVGLVLSSQEGRPRSRTQSGPADWLVGLSVLAGSAEAIERITKMVTRGLRPRIGAAAACITVWDEERSVLRALPGAFGTSSEVLMASISGPPTNVHSLASRVFVTGRPYLTNQADSDPGLLQTYVDVFRLERVMAVPLSIGKHRVGVLILVNKPDAFTIADVSEVEAVAPRIAVAVQLALSVEKIRRSQHMERVLATAATDIAAGKPLAECLLPALRALGTVTESSIAALCPLKLPPVVWRGRPVDPALEDRFMKGAHKMARQAMGAYPHGAGDPGWAAVHAPVTFSAEHVATIALLRQNGVPFGKDEAEAVTRLASLAALAWASERYQHQLAELALSKERSRIADELHDHVSQILFAAQIGLDSLLEGSISREEVNPRLEDIVRLLAKGESAIREVINNFAASAKADLIRRLQLTVDAVQDEFNVYVHVELPDCPTLAGVQRPVADCLVRVAHEAIVNAAKHAGPCRISLRLSAPKEGRLALEVADDGLGIASGSEFTRRHGLCSLKRAVEDAGGTFDVSPGFDSRGTLVKAALPLL